MNVVLIKRKLNEPTLVQCDVGEFYIYIHEITRGHVTLRLHFDRESFDVSRISEHGHPIDTREV